MARIKQVKKQVEGRTNWDRVALSLAGQEEVELKDLGKFDSFEEGADAVCREFNNGSLEQHEVGSDKMKKKVAYFLTHTQVEGVQVEYDDSSKTMFLVACECTDTRELYNQAKAQRATLKEQKTK